MGIALQGVEQPRKGILGEPDIGIEDAEIRRRAAPEGCIVIGAEAFGGVVMDELELETELFGRERQRLGQVDSHQDFNRLGYLRGEILQEQLDELCLAVGNY